jgi:hypothetical protein
MITKNNSKMKKIILVLLISSWLLSFYGLSANGYDPTYISEVKDKTDYVPDAETAIKVAEAIWLPIYGKGIYKSKPFKARLNEEGIWIVEGTLHSKKGGTPYAEIQKRDCKIIMVTHTK